jgi:ADP-ribose pyrophosphatase YjhB (NUDIX family)
MTLGVRAMVIDGSGDVLLIRHGYWPGWHFPGGGVERGETALDSLGRELVEEGGIVLAGEPELFGIYSNESEFRGDHIAFFVVRQFRRLPFAPTREISEARFFSRRTVPEGTTAGTLRRLAEVETGGPRSMRW